MAALHPLLRITSLLLLPLALATAVRGEPFPVSIRVDAGRTHGQLEPIWRFFGADEPNYAYGNHGKKLLGELGELSPGRVFFRTHNLLTSGDGTPDLKWGSTNAYREDSDGNPIYDWTILDRIFDTYLESGVRPYVEIGFMPKDLSVTPEPYQHDWYPGAPYEQIYTGWAYPPKDYQKWEELVYQWAKHCVDRYGKEEVEKWYWQTWNEADIGYWRGKPRSESFHRLHDHAVAGVRRALPTAKVGGPDGAYDGRFLADFLEHCLYGHNDATGQTGTPLDFVSFHAKGGPSFEDGRVRMDIARQLRAIDSSLNVIASYPELKDTPVVIGESDPDGCAACKSSEYPQYGYRNGSQYASYTAAAFARKHALADRHGLHLEGALTWAFTFEDQPYFAGFRALATNGIDKPVLNVFRMFSKLTGERVEVESDHEVPLDRILRRGVRGRPDVSALATLDGQRIQILVWHYHDDAQEGADAAVTLDVHGLPASLTAARLTHYRVDGHHSNAFSRWKEMGEPQHPTGEQIAELERAGQLEELEGADRVALRDGQGTVTFDLPRQGVSLLVLDWSQPNRAIPRRRNDNGRPRVYKERIRPHWLAGGTRFWYRNDLAGETREFILVDAEQGTRARAFDHQRLADALSGASGETYSADHLPLDAIDFDDDGQAVRFEVAGARWTCDLDSYRCTRIEPPSDRDDRQGDESRGRRRRFGRGGPVRSPDGKWTASVQNGNVWVRRADADEPLQLSSDATEESPYGMLEWSPDSKTLVAFRIEPGDRKEVYLIESSPEEGGRAALHSRTYDLPGDKLTTYTLNLFQAEERKQIRPEVEPTDLGRPYLHWKADGRHFLYQKVDRGHQRFRVFCVDAHTGEISTIIDERSDTFIWTAHTENLDLDLVNWLDATDEIVYASERDGWRHLYLVDGKSGEFKCQITKGEFVVRGIDAIDAEDRQVWFQASGMDADQDPYFLHAYRVNLDGTGLVCLTRGNGNHTVQYSPDRRYLIDTYSRVDCPPVHELRRTSDGGLVCRLEESDASELLADGAVLPEPFVAKGRDGETDIWGIICRPRHLDPGRKYPIIEQIYAGPQGSFVPKSFVGGDRFRSLTEQGFIVVQIDGMGTANRSKAFHDVCWKNLKDGGLPDRILWIQAAARKYPYMDTERVGIYGTSAGGQNAAAAVLFHPEFYKAAVANCGCHDNRMDKASWNEQWMGYPVGPQYAECSNIENAHRLEGHLMLIVGEMDTNVPPESTLRFADALIRAGKDFDFLLIPGAGHGAGSAREYWMRRMADFFARHLQGADPPSRNAPPVPAESSGQRAAGPPRG